MNDDLYIVFAECIGNDGDDNFFYRLLFSDNPDVVWGDNFNVTPAAIVPDLEPDSSSISKEYMLTSPMKLYTAVDCTCFSLQDCIDGIIALLFNGDAIGTGKTASILFGMAYEDVERSVRQFGGEMKEVEYKSKKEEDGEEES